jgi:hypothetical protein
LGELAASPQSLAAIATAFGPVIALVDKREEFETSVGVSKCSSNLFGKGAIIEGKNS